MTTTCSAYLYFAFPGVAVQGEAIIKTFYFDRAVAITAITLCTRSAPTGSALVIGLGKNGLTTGATCTLPDGDTYVSEDVGPVSYCTSDKLSLEINSVGSTQPGAWTYGWIHYTPA